MSNEFNKPPPPGPMLPIESDPMSAVEAERRRLRARADAATPPEARDAMREATKAYASAEKLPLVSLPTKKQKPPIGIPSMSNRIIPVDAQGRAKNAPPQTADAAPANTPKLTFSPAADGTFIKAVDRPRPASLPAEQPWTQKFISTHGGHLFAIAQDEYAARAICESMNAYLGAVHARRVSEAAALADANAFQSSPAEESK